MSAVRMLTLSALLAMPLHVWAEEDGESVESFETAEAFGPVVHGRVTHYGYSYHGARMANGQPYSSYDASIVAVGPANYGRYPMGTVLEVSGPAGTIRVVVQDRCGGCSATMLDLSERGNELVCGSPPHTCVASWREVLKP